MFEKVSRLLKYDSIFFGPQTYIAMDTNTDHFTLRVLHVHIRSAMMINLKGGSAEPPKTLFTYNFDQY